MTLLYLKSLLAPIFNAYKDEIVTAYLFGSTVTGTLTSASDVDIALVLSGLGEAASVKVRLYADVSRVLKRNDIDIIVLNSAGNLVLIDEVLRQGAVLFSKDEEARKDFEVSMLHTSHDFKRQRLSFMGV